MSNVDDQADWSNGSALLFRDARRAHDPTPAETARLAVVLERIKAQNAASALTAKRAADVVTPAVRASSHVLRQIAGVSLGGACIAAGVYAYVHFNQQPADPARNDKPVFPAIASAPPPSTAQPIAAHPRNQAGPSARPTAARDETQARSRSQRRRTHAPAERQRASRSAPVSASNTANAAPAEDATTLTAPQFSAAAHDRPELRSTLKAVAQNQSAKPFESEPQHTEAGAADRPPALPPAAAATELAMMKRMQGALRDADFSMALALCAEHARRWPHGVFQLEREGVRAIAACSENTDDAAPRARSFLLAHPQTPVAMRVSAACATQLKQR